MKNSEKNPVEICVVCGKETTYRFNDHIDTRIGYIEGVGQSCNKCYNKKSVNNVSEDPYLENNSYWDIDLLQEYNAETNKKLLDLYEYKPNTLIGKLWKRFNISRLKRKLYHYVQK